MTERLYYTDAYTSEFDAVVLRTSLHEGHTAAVLDRTAFYPTSGGQPHDTGRLGLVRVIDVVDHDGGILHVLEGGIEIGPVRGAVDWDRRFDHMQQHTGQHVFSAAFDRLLQARTVSFHLGASSATIDLSREVTAAEIARAEAEANRVVWEDRPVNVRFAGEEEASGLPLRKEPARGGVLRLVDVEGYDLSACGGTHVARTGAIGLIAVASWERFKGGSRIEFVCGARALKRFHTLRDAVVASVRLVSVLPEELPVGIERLQAEGKDAKRQIKHLHSRLAEFEAGRLVSQKEIIGDQHVVIATLHGWDPAGLKAIASAIVSRPAHVAVLFGEPAPSAAVIARGEGATTDCAGLLNALTTEFGGKGGGRPDLAQGGGLQGPPGDLRAHARTLLDAT